MGFPSQNNTRYLIKSDFPSVFLYKCIFLYTNHTMKVYGHSGGKIPFIFIIGTRYKQLFLLSNSSTPGPNVANILDTKT